MQCFGSPTTWRVLTQNPAGWLTRRMFIPLRISQKSYINVWDRLTTEFPNGQFLAAARSQGTCWDFMLYSTAINWLIFQPGSPTGASHPVGHAPLSGWFLTQEIRTPGRTRQLDLRRFCSLRPPVPAPHCARRRFLAEGDAHSIVSRVMNFPRDRSSWDSTDWFGYVGIVPMANDLRGRFICRPQLVLPGLQQNIKFYTFMGAWNYNCLQANNHWVCCVWLWPTN